MSDTQIPGADLTINCKDGQLYYTSYLLQRVPYYNTLLNGGFKESGTGEINFKYGVEIFKLLVKFIETGTLGLLSYNNMYKLYKLSIFITYDKLHNEIMDHDLDYRIYYKAIEIDDPKPIEKIIKNYTKSTCSVNEQDKIKKNIGKFYKFIITEHKKYLYIFDNVIKGYINKDMFNLAIEHKHEPVIIRYIKRKYIGNYPSERKYDYLSQYPVEIIGYTIKAIMLGNKSPDSLITAFKWLELNQETPDNKNIMFEHIINNYKLFKNNSFSSLYYLIDMFQDDHEKIKQIVKLKLYNK